jgi:hypothetical protein
MVDSAPTPIEAEIARLSDPVHERLGYYVYRLVDRRTSETFYVGKGKGGRLLQHVTDARMTDTETRKLRRIREIEAEGGRVSFLIHRHGLTEKEAFEVEAALIDAYPGALNEADGHYNRDRGCMPLSELISIYDPPKIAITEPAVLINIGQEWHRGLSDDPEKLYERTSRYWACAPDRHLAKYAFAVSRGVIRQVYRIEKWTKHDMRTITYDDGRVKTPAHQLKTIWRYSFDGVPAPEMAHYIGKLVDPARERGDANPIKWVNC